MIMSTVRVTSSRTNCNDAKLQRPNKSNVQVLANGEMLKVARFFFREVARRGFSVAEWLARGMLWLVPAQMAQHFKKTSLPVKDIFL